MMHWCRRLLFHNWQLKLLSVVLAAVLWSVIARESESEIGIEVPLEYQNVPEKTEVISDTTNAVEVRLRGPSNLIKELSAREISATVDLADMAVSTEKIVQLTTEHVHAPFGIEVVGVIPARVRVALEATVSRRVPILPVIRGNPAEGFEAADKLVAPANVQIEGPASRVRLLENVPTSPVDISGRRDGISQIVDLDIADPLIRVPQTQPIRVEVRILAKSAPKPAVPGI